MTNSVHILGRYQVEAREKLQKLAKRAARYGQTITWTERPYVETLSRVRWDGKKEKVAVERVEFVLEGSAPKAGEFRFLATLERSPGGVVISAVPGVEIGKLGRNWDGRCEHCNKPRGRVSGFVVESPNGKRKIVGRSCLRDHMGTDSPAGLLQVFTCYQDALGMGDDEESGWGGAGRWQETTVGLVAASRAAIAIWGWIPSSAEGMTTRGYATLVFARTNKSNQADQKLLLDELAKRGDHYAEVAEKVVAWGRNLKGRSDYEHNLRVALSNDWVVEKRVGLVVSAAAAYDRQVAKVEEEKAKAASLPPSYHFGEVGQRASAVVVVERLIGLPDNGFGPSTIYVLREEKGALISWKTSGDARLGGDRVEVGTRALATFTVKAHTTFREQPETRVLRCKFAAIETAAKAA